MTTSAELATVASLICFDFKEIHKHPPMEDGYSNGILRTVNRTKAYLCAGSNYVGKNIITGFHKY